MASKVRFADTIDKLNEIQSLGFTPDQRSNKLESVNQSTILKRNDMREHLYNSDSAQTPYRSRKVSKQEDERLETDRSLSSSLKKHQANKLSILEQSGIEVLRNGKLLDNDQLFDKIRVPDKIVRKFKVARDHNEQVQSCDRLSNNKKPFVVPPIVHEKVRKPSNMRNSMHKTKQAKTSRPIAVKAMNDKDDTELNNVKITDYQSKEMLLLTSQIFYIRQDAMQESKTSAFYRNSDNQASIKTQTSRLSSKP